MNPFAISEADIQKSIDEQLAARGLDRYVEWAKHIPQGSADPEGTTHRFSLYCAANKQEIAIALKVKQPFATMVNTLANVY